MTTVGEALAAGLAERGVDTVFGIPGVHSLELYRGLAGSGLRHVTPRHEQGGAFAADGYARVAGRPGVCFTISGPGLTNALTPLAQARQDSTPLLVVSACVRRDQRGRGLGVIHDLPDQLAVTSAIARLALSVDEPEGLDDAVGAAWDVLEGRAGPRGPVHLQVPADVLALPAVPGQSGARSQERAAADAEAVDRAAALIGTARRPAMLLGGGARDAGPAAIALAEHIGAPIGLSINAKGAIPSDHPLCVASRMMFEPAATLFCDADVVIAVGTQLSELDWWGRPQGFVPRGDVVRIDIDSAVLDANVPAAIGIVGDAAATLRAIAVALGPPPAEARPGAVEAVGSALAGLRWPPEISRHLPLVRALDGALPADRIVCVDSTQPGYAANHALDVDHPGSWLMPIGYGSLGTALPMAIGASLAAPRRPVLALAGDGGVVFTIQELATARELGLGLPLVVWDNGGYGEIRDAMGAAHVPVLGCDATTFDLPRVAEGFGCLGARAESLDDLGQLVANALEASVPTLIAVDPSTRGIDG
jgi:acetolactate synthase I/II/III large subunit